MTEQNQQAKDAQFMIQRIYVKDISFETSNTPAVFQQKWEPELSLDLNTEHNKIEENIYDVALTVTATVKNQGETAFLCEVKQAGIFTIQGAAEEQLNHLLGSFCPNILFPYAREAITAEVIRGSFPQLVLAPINFDALYMQQMEEKKKAAKEGAGESAH
tara:strand:+ start:1012 stop:1491 length:480 start_codon:yes stop_codon:yes gene_type:complete